MLGACGGSSKTSGQGALQGLTPPATRSSETVVPPATAPAPEATAGGPTVPTMEGETGMVKTVKTGTKPTAEKSEAGGKGKVMTSAEAKRTAGHFYLTILTSKDEALAKKDAAFLASHGISVTVDNVGKGLFQVVSVEGFEKTTEAAAKAFKAKVIAIGKEHPSAKGSKGAWDDAYFRKHGAAKATKSATAKPAK